MRTVSMRDVLAAYGESHPPAAGDGRDYREVERRAEVDGALLTLALDGLTAEREGGYDDAA